MAATALLAATALAGAYSQAEAAKSQAKFESKQAEAQARLNELKAQDALERGEKEAREVRRRSKQVGGAQRAAMAAQGIAIGEGSSAELLTETEQFGALDAITARNNAWREAWGYRVEAQNLRSDAQFKKRAARHAANMTLLTGGLQAASYGAEGFSKTSDGGGGGKSKTSRKDYDTDFSYKSSNYGSYGRGK